jgi:hypothetical protein
LEPGAEVDVLTVVEFEALAPEGASDNGSRKEENSRTTANSTHGRLW